MRILKKHRLKHIPELRVDPEVFTQRFSPSTSMCNCNGKCCQDGVLLDVEEKKRILAHTELIQRYLEPQQEHDPAKWFDGLEETDQDFLSGRCDGTAVKGHGCVFLDSRGLCTLQKVAMAEGMDKFALKPFYCVAFPLTIDEQVLTTYESEFTNRRQCCSISEQGSLTIFDVCKEELEYILGAEGLQEMYDLFHHASLSSAAEGA